jgi:hypothetical protein
MEGFRCCGESVYLTLSIPYYRTYWCFRPSQGLKFISPLEIMQTAYFVDKKRLDCTLIERLGSSHPSVQEYVPSSMPGESQEVDPPAQRPLRRATSRAPSITPASPPRPNVRQESVIESQTPAPEAVIPARKVRPCHTFSAPTD